jgi:hypothetical protein
MTATVYSFCYPTCPCQQGNGLLLTPYLASEGDRQGADLVQHSIRRWNLSLMARTSFPATFQHWWAAAAMNGPVWKAMEPDSEHDAASCPALDVAA